MKQFTIITVCLNTEAEIEKTIRSVLEQDYTDFEYLIKDGGSTDQTLKIAESFADAFAERGITYRVISRPDQGVYDAMNQAVQEARGEWLLFLNAGDWFVQKSILSRFHAEPAMTKADIVYGDMCFRDEDLYGIIKAQPLESIRFRYPFCHQCLFTRRTLLCDSPYSTRYRICSDYQFYLRMFQEGKNFAYVPVVVSVFSKGGISSDTIACEQEVLKMFEEMPERDEEAIQRQRELCKSVAKREGLARIVRKLVPKKLLRIRKTYIYDWKTEAEILSEVSNGA